MATQIINPNSTVHRYTDEEWEQVQFEHDNYQRYKDYGRYVPDWLWDILTRTHPDNPNHSDFYKYINGKKNILDWLLPDNTAIGKFVRGDASDLADLIDTLSGNKIAYERSKEERDYANNWNSEAAQVARMLAAGLNPYMSGVGSSQSSPGSVPSPAGPGPAVDFMSAMGSALFGGISSLLNGEVPERYARVRAMKEEILGKRLENAEKEKNLGLNADKIRAEINKLYHDLNLDDSEESRNEQRFEEEKRTWLRSQEEHTKRMIEFDDKHKIVAHDISQWSTRDAIEQAQLIALQNSNTQQEYQMNVLNELEKAKLIAETNSIINSDNFKWSQFRYQQERDAKEDEQFDREWEWKENEYHWSHEHHYNREKIESLQIALLNNQISTAQYEATLRKYGLSPRSPRFMKQAAGVAEEVPDYATDFLFNVLDTAPSIIGGVFK